MFKFDKNFLQRIIDFNHHSWTPSFNLFKGLLWDELIGLAGFKPDEHMLSLEERRIIAKENCKVPSGKRVELSRSYPTKFSWLDFNGINYLTPVKNQGFCSSCVAFGLLAVMETMLRYKKSNIPNLSEAQLFFTSPGFSRDGGQGKHNCKTGWNIEPALDFLENTGVVTEDEYPYDSDNKFRTLPGGWENTTTKITGSTQLNSHEEMKSWISSIGPVISVIEIKADFIFYGKGIYNHIIGPSLGGHCICVIGYNDDYQAWLCKNSWSEHWGENGYFWIGYDQCGIGAQMWGINDVK